MSTKRITLSLAMMVCTLCMFAAGKPVYSNSDLTITPIDPGIYVVETSDKTTMYIVEGTERALLIDTGTDCKDLHKVVRKITKKPYDVVLTHCHYDHAGNVRYFDHVYMHPADSVLIPDGPMRDYAGEVRYINEGHVFDLGGIKLETVLFPGHTPGSIALIDFDRGIAFTGDAFGSGQVWLQLAPHVSMATYILSCQRMIDLMKTRDINKLYVGHYPYPKRPLDIDYMNDMITLARKVFNGDTEDAEVFGDPESRTGGWLIRNGQAEIVFKKKPVDKVCMLKLDDVHYGENGARVTPRWERAAKFVADNGLKAGFGIIGYSLADGDEHDGYFDWIQYYNDCPGIEFWNHGFHNRMSMDEQGEFEQPFADQYRALHLTDSLAMEKLGIALNVWGPHWTDVNVDTDRALSMIPNLRMTLGAPENAQYFKGFVFETPLWMEYPVHNPNYDEFVKHYNELGDDLGLFYLQGHPNSWDGERWENFVKIVRFLQDEGVLFVSPSEVMTIKGVML